MHLRILPALTLAVCLSGCAAVVRIDTVHLPESVRFTDIRTSWEENARKQLTYAMERVLFVENMTDMMGGPVICGPFLWERIKTSAEAEGMIADDVTYLITVPDSASGCRTLTLNGKRIFSHTDKKIFNRLLQHAVIGTSAFTIRKPEFHETQLLWKRTGGSMQEPYFMVEAGSLQLLIDLDYIDRPQSVPGERESYSDASIRYIDEYSGFRTRILDRYAPDPAGHRSILFVPQSPNPLENKKPRPRT